MCVYICMYIYRIPPSAFAQRPTCLLSVLSCARSLPFPWKLRLLKHCQHRLDQSGFHCSCCSFTCLLIIYSKV